MEVLRPFDEEPYRELSGAKLDIAVMFQRDIALRMAIIDRAAKEKATMRAVSKKRLGKRRRRLLGFLILILFLYLVLDRIPARWIVGRREVDRVFPELAKNRQPLLRQPNGTE